MDPHYTCPSCEAKHPAPFRSACPSCGFSVAHLAGQSLSDFQNGKWDKHTELLRGQNISLHSGDYNASFDHVGSGSLGELVRFALSYGHESEVPANRGPHVNPVRIAYIPQVIGSGISAYTSTPIACSGVCIISPGSLEYGHAYPVLNQWVQEEFAGKSGQCAFCGTPTAFGHPICQKCYEDRDGDWTKLL